MNTASRSKMSTAGIGHLAMDEQRHADPLHRLQRGRSVRDVGDAVGGVGRGVGRIELAAANTPSSKPRDDLGRVGMVGEVAGHQRREAAPVRQRREDPRRDRPRPPRRWSPAAPGWASRSRARTAARCNGATAFSISPSRRWTCQSSGRRMARRSVMASCAGLLAHRFLPFARRAARLKANGLDRQCLHRMAATTLVDRALIRLSGEDVRGFLQGLVTNDVDRAGAGPAALGGAADRAGQGAVRLHPLGGRRRRADRLRGRRRPTRWPGG